MRPVVLDCSAVVPWFFPEQHEESTDRLQAEFGVGAVLGIAPRLLLTEFSSVVLEKVRRGQCDAWRAAGQLERFLALPIRYAEHTSVLVKGAYALAHEMEITMYDASYLWLASRGDAALATADRRLAGVAGELGVALYA